MFDYLYGSFWNCTPLSVPRNWPKSGRARLGIGAVHSVATQAINYARALHFKKSTASSLSC